MPSAAAINPARASAAELARMLDVSRQAIHDLKRRHIITPDANGKFDVELARVAITNRVRPSGKAAQAVTAAATPTDAPRATSEGANDAEEPSTEDTAISYHVAKTLRETAEARIAQRKLAEMEARLTDAEDVARAIWTAFRTLRDSVMPLGRRMSSRLSTLTDQREIQLLIDDEMRTALNAFRERMLQPILINHAPAAATADDEADETGAANDQPR